MGKIIRFFPDTDLRCGHDGLSDIAKKHKINTQNLKDGEYLLFTNKARTKLKMYTSNNIIAYLKLREGKLNLRTIKHIPQCFDGKEINYSKALRKAMLERLGK